MGALSIRGLRTLVAALAITAVALGVLEIGIPAFAEREGSRGDAGWLFALWGVGLARRRALVRRAPVAAAAPHGASSSSPRAWRSASRRCRSPARCRCSPCSSSSPGLGLAPSTAACYSLVGELAPEGALTEAYAWQIVAYVTGSAVGAWIAGVIVEEVGVDRGARVCARRRGAGAPRGGGRRSLA